MDWEQAKEYLDKCIKIYSEVDCGYCPGEFALRMFILPLKRRYDKGERTQELHDEIMEISL